MMSSLNCFGGEHQAVFLAHAVKLVRLWTVGLGVAGGSSFIAQKLHDCVPLYC
jgi:hypothetical protein